MTEIASATPNPLDGLPPEPPRRFTLKAALAVVISAVLPAPAILGALGVLLNPLRPSVRKKNLPSGSDDKGFYKLGEAGDLTPESPVPVKIFATVRDAWAVQPDHPIGACYLVKRGDGKVDAFSAVCPHAGCFVDYHADEKQFHCPCHDSQFDIQGKRGPTSPSARDLDSLECEVRDGDVWVKYQDFKTGSPEKVENT
jgi:nitrite reductase/ring-hydroxylating ferredoxin subunit